MPPSSCSTARSLTGRRAASRWVSQPTGSGTALLVSLIADSRPLTGLALGRSVTDALADATRSFDFTEGVLNLALHYRPPTGFVRDFVVEHSGEHRGELDLKHGGLVPVASIARWAAIVTRDVRGSTTERLRRAQQAGLLTADEASSLTGAFEEIFGLVMAREIDAIKDGSAAQQVPGARRSRLAHPPAAARDVPGHLGCAGHAGGRVDIQGQVRLGRPPARAGTSPAPTRGPRCALDQPWRSARYCAVDLETTGLDLRRDAIISFGSVGIDGGRVIAGSSIYRLVSGPARVSPDGDRRAFPARRRTWRTPRPGRSRWTCCSKR